MQNIRWRKPQLESASEADIIGMSPLAMKASQMVLGTRNNTKACSTASDPLHIDSWRVQSLMYHHAMVASQLERGKYNKSCTEARLADRVQMSRRLHMSFTKTQVMFARVRLLR